MPGKRYPLCGFMGSRSGSVRPSSASLDLVFICREEELAGNVHLYLEPDCGEANVHRLTIGGTIVLAELVAHVSKCIRWASDDFDFLLPNDVHGLGPTRTEGCHCNLAQGNSFHSPRYSGRKLAPARAMRYSRPHTQKAVVGVPPKVQA